MLRTSGAVAAVGLLVGAAAAPAPVAAQEFPTSAVYDQPLFPDVNPSFRLRVAYLDPPNPFLANEHAQCIVFKNVIERGTQGDVFVECFPSGALGNEVAMIEQAEIGAIQAFIVAEGAVPSFFPEVQVLALPYAFRDHAHAYHVLDGPFGQELKAAILEASDFRVLALAENGGFRNFTSNRPLRSADDIQGQSFRTMNHPGHMAIVNALGGSATPIPWPELYTSLETGVIDGQENPVPVINFGRLYEVQDYLILDGHVYSLDFMFMPEDFFQSLPEAYQELVLKAGQQSAVVARGINRILEWEALARFERDGSFREIIVPTAEEKVVFAERTQAPFLEWYHSAVDPDQVWSTKLMEAIEAADAHFRGDRGF
ncbi:MAG: DctP family TRAP transporter solute-binding subunit [Geminicoccaceae bacterium]|nr:MAG: DctP family TRAP transporter solute-binding subunit [Geminicoccaceae bacterium]